MHRITALTGYAFAAVRRRYHRGVKRFLVAGVLAVAICFGAGFDTDLMHSPDAAIRKRLLQTGEFHGNEVFGRQGERWLALVRSSVGYRAEMRTLRVRRVPDPIDGAPEPAKQIGTVEPGQTVFLLRGFDRLAGRAVPTAFDGAVPLTPHGEVRLFFAGREVNLNVLPNGKHESFENEQVPMYQVNFVLANREERMIPLPVVVSEYNHARLLWADLDADGKLDLLLQDSGFNRSSTRLFLSSTARPGEVVREVAQFYTTGC